MKKLFALVLALAMVLALAACGGGDSGNAGSTGGDTQTTEPAGSGDTQTTEPAGDDTTPAGETMNITLITMDQMDVHWVKLEKAARAKVEELQAAGKDINYSWLAPEKKDNAQQIAQIETAINDGADAIIISVNDSTACNDALQAALDKGIKLIYVDATASLEASATFATDNYAAGAQAGEAMKGYLADAGLTEGTIGLVSAQAGVQSCIDRVDGFVSAFEGTGFTMSEVQYSDGDAVKAQELTNALINDGVIAVYGANDGATTGAGNATKEANSNGNSIICVGFDNSSSNRGLVRDGSLLAFMAQNPNVMGEKSIEAAVALLEGEALSETQVDTGVSVVTIDNVDQFED
ncbi:MAG: substrate-binding domain-containing protein [Oscillospiraceae bacterium]|jgi:ribose transport system substrate-binding protein|nr:substrate-binding domain-containing protein [Oscillospiraceae bacterium]MCI8877875.1 substrate-binding domain-containing protein [Oscillospiraceae bacterium]